MGMRGGSSSELEFEGILSALGKFGRYQICFCIAVAIGGTFAPAVVMNSLLLTAPLEYTCQTPSETQFTVAKACNETWTNIQHELTLPWDNESQSYDHCNRFQLHAVVDPVNCTYWYPISNSTRSTVTLNTTKCTSWNYTEGVLRSTVASKFDLVCDDSLMSYMPSLSFMLGILVGALIFGSLSDRFGRKPVLVFAFVTLSVCGFAGTYVGNFTAFCVLILLSGAGYMGTAISGYILGLEIISGRHRPIVGACIQCTFSVSFMVTALLGALARDWTTATHISCAVIIITTLIFITVLYESPRWLYAQGKEKEAEIVLKKMAKVNKREDKLIYAMQEQRNNSTGDDKSLVTNGVEKKQTKYSILILLKNSTLRKMTAILGYNWFALTCVFYGLSFSSTSLGGNLFLNLFFNGLVEIPGNLLIGYLMNFWGRRPVISLFHTFSGISLILMMFSSEIYWVNLILFLIGKFGTSGAFTGIYLYSSELYPTPIRGNGVGCCNGCSRIGGLFAVAITMLGPQHPSLPFVLFGIIGLLAGILVCLLPETKYAAFPDTLKECEDTYKNRKISLKSQCIPCIFKR